jgi:adenine-specific DNA methylase
MGNKNVIEEDFPFAQISKVAEQESWRKEVYRPLSYIHKWWARRLGSVFRGLLIGAFENNDCSFMEKFYSDIQYNNKVVFDPFMGSGTTVTEAVKLGAKVVGSDINPVAVTMVKAALSNYDKKDVLIQYDKIERECQAKIQEFYQTIHEQQLTKVLYYFWVNTLECSQCGAEVSLFKNMIFSKNAYPSKKPMSQSICPHCNGINEVHYLSENEVCRHCNTTYNPQKGNVEKNDYICPVCGKREKIVKYIRTKKKMLNYKMYAKIVLDSMGKKQYVSITDYDEELYLKAIEELSSYEKYIPNERINEGHNTNQILNYQYKQWREMFNCRQLLSFGILTEAILKIEDENLRRLFSILMSGSLEFNNMFCSFKGEGTGAVRPLFYNHILKNELMPLEANVWGGAGSSGGFSNMFKSRILRSLEYKESPYEIKLVDGKKADRFYIPNCKIEMDFTQSIESWEPNNPLLLCGDSANSGLPDKSIDLVLTDPPFFDNVNYSELADFFFVWLKKLSINIDNKECETTRLQTEVQDKNAKCFSDKLQNVLLECHRVLTDSGNLIFTYHHSRTEGWVSVYNAIAGAGFRITKVVPIKAEMSVSVSILAAKRPINYDLVFVCRKILPDDDIEDIQLLFEDINIDYVLDKFTSAGLKFSIGDKMILLYGEILRCLSSHGKRSITKEDIDSIEKLINYDILCS